MQTSEFTVGLNPDGSWYILLDGEVQYELERDSDLAAFAADFRFSNQSFLDGKKDANL